METVHRHEAVPAGSPLPESLRILKERVWEIVKQYGPLVTAGVGMMSLIMYLNTLHGNRPHRARGLESADFVFKAAEVAVGFVVWLGVGMYVGHRWGRAEETDERDSASPHKRNMYYNVKTYRWENT